MAALGSNDSLQEVDLAENLIGKQETQKVSLLHTNSITTRVTVTQHML